MGEIISGESADPLGRLWVTLKGQIRGLTKYCPLPNTLFDDKVY